MPPRIEGDGLDFGVRAHDRMQENLILQSEACRENDPPWDGFFDGENARLKIGGGGKRMVERISEALAFAVIEMTIFQRPVHGFPFSFALESRTSVRFRDHDRRHGEAAVPDGTVR